MKKLIVLVLCLMMVATNALALTYNEPGTYPIADEVVTVRIFAPQDGENSRADNIHTKELEEKLGIKIEWVIAPADDIRSKLNLLFAGQNAEKVDLVLTGVSQRLDMVTEAQLAAQGLLLPLNEFYENSSVGYKAAFEDMPGMREFITQPNGNIYNLPNVDGSLHVQFQLKCWINQKWLDNLGLEMPTTTEEFYQVMKAFKEQDANGNGDPNDEIPLSTSKNGVSAAIDGFLMAPFQLTPNTTRMYVDNGVVSYAPVQEGYREGLRYLNKLYTEGLLNPESFTQQSSNQVNVNENGEDTVIGCFLALRPGYATNMAADGARKWEEYRILAPLKGPSGEAISEWNPYVMYQTGMAFIPAGAQNPEAAFRLVDYLATYEGTMRSCWGIEGVHWTKAAEGTVGLDGSPAVVEILPAYREQQNFRWDQLAGYVRNTAFTVMQATNPDPYAPEVAPLDGRQMVMYKGSLLHQAVAQPLDTVLPSLYFTEDAAEEIALLQTTVNDYQQECMVAFITGTMSIEDDWDSYVETIKSIALDDYLALYQEAYDASAFSAK